MAHNLLPFFLLLLSLNAPTLLAGREIPKKPESFVDLPDRSILIPGIGRAMIPKKGTHFNPFTYNPVTGTNSGTGITFPDIGGIGSGGTGGSYIPGGDDTTVPNPGFEVPKPGSGTRIPAPASP